MGAGPLARSVCPVASNPVGDLVHVDEPPYLVHLILPVHEGNPQVFEAPTPRAVSIIGGHDVLHPFPKERESWQPSNVRVYYNFFLLAFSEDCHIANLSQ
jgi:hypothetical protein